MSQIKYVLVRSNGAGVHAGYLASPEGADVVLTSTRRLWQWRGANHLSDIATFGVKYPKDCRFSDFQARNHIFQVIEILDITEEGRKSIESVPIWKVS